MNAVRRHIKTEEGTKRMNLFQKIKALFHRGDRKISEEAPPTEKPQGGRIQKNCKNCGKVFSVDPNWKHIPNYCRDCRQKFAREREEQQRQGPARRIKRICKQCGKVFTFPNTLAHYPSYCQNCRKSHQAAMKSKYGNPVQRKKDSASGGKKPREV